MQQVKAHGDLSITNTEDIHIWSKICYSIKKSKRIVRFTLGGEEYALADDLS